MPVAVGSELDCEWVVGRCKSYLERGDRHSAKAWILTARSLFPGDFGVQVWCACIRMLLLHMYLYSRLVFCEWSVDPMHSLTPITTIFFGYCSYKLTLTHDYDYIF